jgi:hypothetical protein
MHKAIFVLFLAGALGVGCSEQPKESNEEGLRDTPPETAQRAPAEHSMTGCVRRGEGAGSFVLTDETGLQLAQIADSVPDLGPHVGHKVEITGSAVANAPGHTMKVSELKMISARCL